jgi:hypothetical protein
VRVREGDPASVTPAGKPKISLTPTLVESGVVQLTVAVEGQGTTDSVRLEQGVSVKVEAPVPLQVEFVRATTADAVIKDPQGPCTECCVLCEGKLWCACLVQTACGDCCCPDTCPCSPGIRERATVRPVR